MIHSAINARLIIRRCGSIETELLPAFSSSNLSGLTTALLQAYGCPRLFLLIDALAGQTGRTNPAAAITGPSGFVLQTRFAAKGVTTRDAGDLRDSFQNFQILGGRDSANGLSHDRHAILENRCAIELRH